MDMAVLLQTGLWAPNSGGLYDVADKIRERWPDAWVRVLPHTADLKWRQKPDEPSVIEELEQLDPVILAHIAHSLGVGEGLPNLANNISRQVTIAAVIDGVPPNDYVGSLVKTERAIPIPRNVGQVFTARTLNRPMLSLDPWGRSVFDARLVRRVVFSGARDNYEDNFTRYIDDASVRHANICWNAPLQDELMDLLEWQMDNLEEIRTRQAYQLRLRPPES